MSAAPKKKYQVPVFIDESWHDVVWPWTKKNAGPYVEVEFYKTRHTVKLNMGRTLVGTHLEKTYHVFTLSGQKQLIAAAREYSRNLGGCRMGEYFIEIINVSPSVSGTLAERLAQIASCEYCDVDFDGLKSIRVEGVGIHGHILTEKTVKEPRYRDSIWDNDEARRREKDDPANWWKK